ncbi:MAG TPA: prepilin peptidase [Candidatus Saccharimonadales bacterium]|nr:prepilin peptidase [Candidatus Saccharimonadales bacterium]
MLSLIIFLVFLFGLFIGSFLNVIVDRSSSGENPLKGRSHCDSCKHVLTAHDLIPVVSFVLLNGKCRYCRHDMSVYYPLVEVITGLIFALVAYFVINLNPVYAEGSINMLFFSLFFYLFLTSILVVIFLTDLKFGIIPFNFVLIGLVATIFLHILWPVPGVTIQNYFLSGTGLFLFFLLIFLITRGKGMGFGDVVYSFLMGFILGYPGVIVGFYIAVLTGAIIPLVILGLKHKKIRGATIPFGPFLVTGTFISMFWGDSIIAAILPKLFKY